MARFVSGLDWSGDPGDPRKSAKANHAFIVSICTVALMDHEVLDECLTNLRKRLGVSPAHVFRHSDASTRSRKEFFSALSSAPVTMKCLLVDKNDWDSEYLDRASGPERIRHSIVHLVSLLPDELIAGQKLLVDMHRGEKAFVDFIRHDVRLSLKVQNRSSFGKVVARPDNRGDAAVIQVADMFAGEVRVTNGGFHWNESRRLVIHTLD